MFVMDVRLEEDAACKNMNTVVIRILLTQERKIQPTVVFQRNFGFGSKGRAGGGQDHCEGGL